jgi:hypothetical protein
VRHGGDLDNRLKVLLDALRVPNSDQLPALSAPAAKEDPFYTVLEDDALVTRLNVEADRLLDPDSNDESDVLLLLQVTVRAARVTVDTMGLGE